MFLHAVLPCAIWNHLFSAYCLISSRLLLCGLPTLRFVCLGRQWVSGEMEVYISIDLVESRQLPLQFSNTCFYIYYFGSLLDFFVPCSTPKTDAEHRPLHCSLHYLADLWSFFAGVIFPGHMLLLLQVSKSFLLKFIGCHYF